jgi:hypothetical protein
VEVSEPQERGSRRVQSNRSDAFRPDEDSRHSRVKESAMQGGSYNIRE